MLLFTLEFCITFFLLFTLSTTNLWVFPCKYNYVDALISAYCVYVHVFTGVEGGIHECNGVFDRPNTVLGPILYHLHDCTAYGRAIGTVL